jgi:hypothetical protein
MNNTDKLTTTTGSGAQASTQNPQVATQDNQTQNSQTIQPGTAANLLNSTQGISLNNVAVPLVSLTTSTTTASVAPLASHRTINPVLGGLSVLLFVLAIGLFVLTSRTSKNTTI